MTGSSLAVSVLGQLTSIFAPSMTDCWMRHLPRITVHGARSFGVACPCNLWTPVLQKIFNRSGRVRLSFQVVVGGAISAWIAAMASVDCQKMVLVQKVLKNPVWCGLLVEFLVGLKRTWEQKLSSGLLLTFMTTHLFQFRFADAEHYWLITLTFFRTWDQELSQRAQKDPFARMRTSCRPLLKNQTVIPGDS